MRNGMGGCMWEFFLNRTFCKRGTCGKIRSCGVFIFFRSVFGVDVLTEWVA